MYRLYNQEFTPIQEIITKDWRLCWVATTPLHVKKKGTINVPPLFNYLKLLKDY
jgi:hypothetical protein